MTDALRIAPANEASWDDLQLVLTGTAARCQCARVRVGDGPYFRMPEEQRAFLLREDTHCDDPRSTETSGIVAWLDDEPVGWCAVDRRPEFARMRGSQVPWAGRHEDPDDDTVWAIACLVVRRGFRRRGYMTQLVAGAVEHARSRGAAAIEGYPMLTEGQTIGWTEEFRVGSANAFSAAGFAEVSHPTKRRLVMRIDF